MRTVIATFLAACVSSMLSVPAVAGSARAAFDVPRIEQLTGARGALDEKTGVLKLTVPHSDLSVSVAGVKMTSVMGLSSWASFQRAGQRTMMMGELALFEDQVMPVMSIVLDNGLEVTALHNRFMWDTPRVMFMNVTGLGEPDKLAAALGKVFAVIQATVSTTRDVVHTDINTAQASFNPQKLEEILGVRGTLTNGVYKLILGRVIKRGGYAVGATMGMDNWAVFAGSDDKAVVDGDVVMRESELQPVLKALRASGLNVVGIHNHMTLELPRTIFVHFWGVGALTDLARGVKAALAAQAK